MNRREFQIGLIAVIGAGAAGLANASVVENASVNRTYRYRLRYVRKAEVLRLWMRVSDINSLSRDLGFLLFLSTDPGGSNIIKTQNYVATALGSHIVKDKITIERGLWLPGAPLFGSLRIDGSQTPSRVWRLA